MKIGIIGSGIVAQTLGSGFIKHGYDVMLGSRNASKLDEWKARSGGQVGSFSETAAFGELVVLAVKGGFAQHALEIAGSENIKGKVVIDTTNPIADESPTNGVLKFTSTINSSLMEQLQGTFSEVKFVKAFNSVGNALMVNPELSSTPSMFICGNDDQAKFKVKEILTKFGWETEDMGAVEAARAIEPLCMLWCIPGFRSGEWEHAFKLVR